MSRLKKTIVIFAPPPKERDYWPRGIEDPLPGNLAMEKYAKDHWKGDWESLKAERELLIETLVGAGVRLLVLPYPSMRVCEALKLSHDLEFLRDPFMMNPKGEVLLFNMGASGRQSEVTFFEELFKAFDFPLSYLKEGKNEGGNNKRLFLPNEKVELYSALSPRSEKNGIESTAEFLGIKKDELFVFELKEIFHIDCVFSPLVNKEEKRLILIHPESFTQESQAEMYSMIKNQEAEVLLLNDSDIPELVANGLQVGEDWFYSANDLDGKMPSCFETQSIRAHLSPIHESIPLSGGVHCLTNELWLPEEWTEEKLNSLLVKCELFGKGAEAKLYN